MQLDSYLVWGRHQLFAAVLNLYSEVCTQGTMYFMASAALKPSIGCTPFANVTRAPSIYHVNVTAYGPPPSEVVYQIMSDGCAAIATNQCATVTLHSEYHSIAVDWQLVCDRVTLLYQPATWQMLGVLVGAPCWGHVSDWMGRKPTLMIVWTLHATAQIVTSFVPTYMWFVISRFVLGMIVGGQISVSYVLAAEFIVGDDRFVAFSLAGWAISAMPVALFTYLTGAWRRLLVLQGVLCLPGLPLVYLCALESPRWLLNRGRTDQAIAVLHKVAERNGRTLNEEATNLLKHASSVTKQPSETKPARKHYFWHLCYSWQLTRYSIALGMAWFTTSCATYSIAFNIGNLASSMYINLLILTSISYMAEITAVLCSKIVCRQLGRKPLFLTLLSIALGMYLVIIVCTLIDPLQHRQIIRFSFLCAAAVFSPIWVLIYLLSAELYPTPVRNLANGCMSLCARVGGALAPQLVLLSEYSALWSVCLMGVFIAITWVLLACCIQETRHRPLPEHMPPVTQRIGCGCAGSQTENETYDQYEMEETNKFHNGNGSRINCND